MTQVETKPIKTTTIPLETEPAVVDILPPVAVQQPWRFTLVGLVLAVPLLLLWLEFASLSLGLPFIPKVVQEVQRGRILMRDEKGFMTLAETAGQGANLERHYPQERLAAGVLGFVGDEQKGLYGVELFQNEFLKKGADLVLTLDPKIQASAEATLENAILSTGAESGTVVVMEAKTNRLLAVANAPGFDASNWEASKESIWKNRAFRDTFDPGSTIKGLVAAMLVNEGIADADSPIYAPMQRQYRNAPPINDAIKHRPDLTLKDVLKYSSNVGISRFADRLGARKLHDYLGKFGFGRDVWVKDSSVETGVLTNWQGWRPRDFATHSFGQGFTSTAVQLATAFSVLVNDGQYIAPKLFDGQDIPKPTRVISPEAAKATRTMLEYTVNEGVKRAQVPNYCVGGKTGTSETWVNGKISSSRFHALFAGFFPVDNPKVVIAVQLYAPKSVYHGSLVSAPVFRQIVLETAARYGIAPSPCVKR